MSDHEPGTAVALRQRALVLHPRTARRTAAATGATRTTQMRLDEAVGLARAISLEVAGCEVVPVATANPRTFFGPGGSRPCGLASPRITRIWWWSTGR